MKVCENSGALVLSTQTKAKKYRTVPAILVHLAALLLNSSQYMCSRELYIILLYNIVDNLDTPCADALALFIHQRTRIIYVPTIYVTANAGAMSGNLEKPQPPKFLSSQKREKVRRKEMKERNMRYKLSYIVVL